MALRLAEQYIQAFSQIAKTGNTMLLPSNTGDVGSMVAQAMAIFKGMQAHGTVASQTLYSPPLLLSRAHQTDRRGSIGAVPSLLPPTAESSTAQPYVTASQVKQQQQQHHEEDLKSQQQQHQQQSLKQHLQQQQQATPTKRVTPPVVAPAAEA